jgi:two-component system LytT family response regulator
VRALIVDDEPLARRELLRLLEAHPEVQVVGEAGSAAEAESRIAATDPDLLFLDIHMPSRTGFELLESLDRLPLVVFTTAHDAHALLAFEVGALDYVLKPVSPARLAAAIARVSERLREPQPAWAPLDRPILVREGSNNWLVRLREVETFEAAGNYVQLRFGSHRPLLLRSLATVEQRLDPAHFFRASRSVIVNLEFVERLDTDVRGNLVARLRGGREVPFSRRQSQEFRRRRSL